MRSLPAKTELSRLGSIAGLACLMVLVVAGCAKFPRAFVKAPVPAQGEPTMTQAGNPAGTVGLNDPYPDRRPTMPPSSDPRLAPNEQDRAFHLSNASTPQRHPQVQEAAMGTFPGGEQGPPSSRRPWESDLRQSDLRQADRRQAEPMRQYPPASGNAPPSQVQQTNFQDPVPVAEQGSLPEFAEQEYTEQNEIRRSMPSQGPTVPDARYPSRASTHQQMPPQYPSTNPPLPPRHYGRSVDPRNAADEITTLRGNDLHRPRKFASEQTLELLDQNRDLRDQIKDLQRQLSNSESQVTQTRDKYHSLLEDYRTSMARISELENDNFSLQAQVNLAEKEKKRILAEHQKAMNSIEGMLDSTISTLEMEVLSTSSKSNK